ncbi:sodium/nucleoside cotransporter 1-like isoform X2 [Phalacrocorax aristotelis]|uniref:sodium/nucleoside cotransporter 1-like isoform X2 n=1 Tax=Phalacrocorax aristotelis TaxID=126867 RepID=UPI003F4B1EBB
MEENQITLDNLEKGIDNPAFSSVGEERCYEECDGPRGESKEERRGEWKERFSFYCRKVLQPVSKAKHFCKAHSKVLRRVIQGMLGVAYLCYFIVACSLNFQRALALVIMTAVVVFFFCWSLFKKHCGAKVLLLLRPVCKCFRKFWPWLKWLLCVAPLVGLTVWLALDTSRSPEQFISLAGFCVLVLFLFACSKHHGAVSWRAVFLGLALEFLFALLVLRTTIGVQAFQWLGDQIQFFLGYTTAGSSFVFGNTLITEVFAFQTLPIVVFFSCVMSILYYLGVMQWLIIKISWLLQVSMGTTPAETLSVAGNIFVGQTEAPLLIRPYLADMTRSEIHAVMTGGFSTIAGSVMGAYISFGVICSYVLMPVAFLMGADWADSPLVAELLGIKIFLNEFVAYQQLAQYKKNRLSGLEEWDGSRKQWISERAESIATFALCGFANLSSIGIMLGGLTSMVPQRKSDLASTVLRALLTGICVSMLNACLAGFLHVPTEVGNCVTFLSTANFSSTSYTMYTCCKQLFASSVLENGTLSFTGAWASVAESMLCLTQCCGHYNHTSCVGTT